MVVLFNHARHPQALYSAVESGTAFLLLSSYTFHFWRPVTAINYVEPELNWASFIVTPPFPDYVSGHSTFSGASATVLASFYGTGELPFTTGSDFLPGVYRSFE